jgi:MinD superfamily P-loop ATPase
MKNLVKIAVTGGKGGVGKSTIAVLLSSHFSKKEKTVLVDADVECPNDYLLTGQKLQKPVDKIRAQFPVLIEEKCLSCGLCAQKCRFKAIFSPKGSKPKFFHDLCANCGLCWNICPAGAIKVEKKQTGEIFENRVGENLFLITGRTVGVVDETGPVVSLLKKHALERAKKLNATKIIFDTAPGMHCNVVQAILEVDKAIAVTEPTPLGEHDLELILKLFKEMKISGSVVINQTDLANSKNIFKIAKKHHFPVSKEVFYSRKIAEAYLAGKLSKLKKDYFENE